MTSTPTPGQEAGAIIHGLLGSFEGDLLQSAEGLLNTYFTNLNNSPTQANVVAQSLALAATAPLQLPEMEAEAIQQFASAGLKLTALIPSLVPAPAAPAAAAPAAAPAAAS